MAKHRALVIGAGRIGAGFNWNDDEYTHAGAYRALSDRVELVGFVEPDLMRRVLGGKKWNVPAYETLPIALAALKPDVVSICVQPGDQASVIEQLPPTVNGIWAEKPWVSSLPKYTTYVQVNYMRRGDPFHRQIAELPVGARGSLVVYGKDDIHTRCHFEDLAKWWKVPLDYRVFDGPCAYFLNGSRPRFFDGGGVDGGTCFKAMLGNLLDCLDNGAALWSPAC